MDIKLTAKLSAYTKGIIPKKLSDLDQDIDYIKEAPDDGKIYGRQDKAWVEVNPKGSGDNIDLISNSGLISRRDGDIVYLGLDQKILSKSEYDKLQSLDENTTYYIIDPAKPDLFLNGGTAFSNGFIDDILEEEIESQFKYEISGGDSQSKVFDLQILPLDALGEVK